MAFNSDDIYKGSEYFKKNPDWDDSYTEWKADIIYSLLEKNNIHPKTIVEVGCGGGGVLHHLSLLDNNIEALSGYDISPDAISLASDREGGKLSFYNEDFTLSAKKRHDVLLCIDVIEHVDDVYGFLNKLKDRASYTVFHIPLDISCRTILKPHVIAQQRESVGHIHYFTKEMAEWALRDCGYDILDWIYTKPAIDWGKGENIKGVIKKMLRNFSFALNKKLSVKLWGGYSMMILTTNSK